MRKPLNLVGHKFNRLTVIESAGKNKYKQTVWLCKCDCGNTKEIIGTRLNAGRVKSCGCFNIEMTKKTNTTHGMKGTPTYNSWMSMLQRCTNKKHEKYPNYGGRGIKVTERWRKFENFFGDMGKRPKEKTLDRINVNANYEPSNCKWSTQQEQHNNRTNNIYLTVDGETKTIAEWARFTGQAYHVIHERVRIDGGRIRRYTDKEAVYGK